MSVTGRAAAVAAAMLAALSGGSVTLAAPPPGSPARPNPAIDRPTVSSPIAPARRGSDRPNILFVVLDDIGIDATSWQPFGWNAAPDAPLMPVMQAIADDAVSFTNFWATPE